MHDIPQLSVGDEYGDLQDALLCRPDHYTWLLTNAVVAESMRRGHQLDGDLARQQHAALVALLTGHGVRCHFLDTDPYLPYQVFTRDSSAGTPWGPVLTQLAKHWRRGEYASVLDFHGHNRLLGMITAGTLEGGDVLVLGREHVMIGHGESRTQQRSAEQLGAWFADRGWAVRVQGFDEHFLHLDLLVGVASSDTALVCTEAIDPDAVRFVEKAGFDVEDVRYGEAVHLGCNVVALGRGHVVVPASAPTVAERLRDRGLDVLMPDLSMFTLAGGGPHCLVQPLVRS